MKNENIDALIDKKNRGGARKNAGRKNKRETAVIRVPEHYKNLLVEISKFLESGDNELTIDHYRDYLDQRRSLKIVTKIKL